MFFFVFKFYLLQKRCSLNVLNMILETPNFKVTGKLEYPCVLFVFSLFSNIVISNV
jgi:hypothetical protein